jgi:hypothetical protein
LDKETGGKMRLIKDEKGDPQAVIHKFKVYILDSQYHDNDVAEGKTCIEYVLKEDIEAAVQEGWRLLLKDLQKHMKKVKKNGKK